MSDDDKRYGRLFISYSRRNKAAVYPLAEALTEAGVEIWIDREEIQPSEDFPARIRDGLARSHALLAWYSPEYAQSSYCQKELTAAWICAQRLTRDVLARILVLNPEETVGHIALGDVGRQNYLAAPKDPEALAALVQAIRARLAGLRENFAAVLEFRQPDWHPSLQFGSSRFVGRLQELWRIHTALNPVGISDHENPSVTVQLAGLGGIGKSLLAVEYAKRFGAAYPGGVHWLRAYGFGPKKPMDPEARERERRSQIENLAIDHGIPIRDKEFREVQRDLGRKLAAGEPYLWIVDDLPQGLDQEQGLPGWCAPSGNGRTLITTRSRDYSGLGITVEIDVLDPAAALELLTQVRKPRSGQERQDAEALAEDLGRHALALDVAGHFLLEDKGFAALRGELASIKSDLLGKIIAGLEGQLPGGHEKSIVATLWQSVRLLKEEGLSLLRLACELQGGTPIPLRLVEKTFGYAFGLNEQMAGNWRRSALNQVKAHSLGTVSLGGAGGDALSVHALVRYTLLHGDPAEKEAALLRRKLREGALSALADLLPDVADIRSHAWLAFEVEHARHLAAQPGTEAEAAVAFWVARYEGARGNYREARAIVESASPVQTEARGARHPDTLAFRFHLALWTGFAGEPRTALDLFQAILPEVKKVLGRDDPLTLATRFNIAHWTSHTGDPEKALRLFSALLPRQERVLGLYDTDTLATRQNIAACIQETGDPELALRVYQALLPDLERVLGVDDPNVLLTRNNIAGCFGKIGNADEALKLSRGLLPDQRRVLGADHPDTLLTRANIAASIGEAGEAHEALRLLRELLPDLTRVLGADHPLTLTIRNNIAEWTGQTGEADEALRLFRELLPDHTRVLGGDHPDTLRARAKIADWTWQIGEANEALRLFRELLPHQIRVLGADHANTLTIRANIAHLTGQTVGAHEALQLLQEVLPDMTRVLGADHPDTLTLRANIADCAGRVGEAMRLFWEIMPHFRGAQPPGEAREALRLYQELLPDQTRVLGGDRPDTLRTRANIASWTARTGDPSGALRLFRELLPDQGRALGSGHSDTKNTREWIRLLEGQEQG